MRIQFCHNCTEEIIAEFEVERAPTREEVEAIYDDIAAKMDEWERREGDFADFDFWQCCHDVLAKYIVLVPSPVVKTFYI